MSVDAAALFEQEARRMLPQARHAPAIVGLCGAQGSGKSTVVATVAARLSKQGIAVAQLSLDDLYLTARERRQLAATIHPLLKTRGVPGTHDIALGQAVLDGLASGAPTRLPRFDKARDDRCPAAQWPLSPADTQIVLLEGWCIGARPQAEEALIDPVNALEAVEDAEGHWRRHVNTQLAGPYQSLFGRMSSLTLLLAPDFAVVRQWRTQQEQDLRRRSPGAGMSDDQIDRFVAHYERITRHIMQEMPGRCDRVIRLDESRNLSI